MKLAVANSYVAHTFCVTEPRRGASALELAILLPLIMLLAIGIVDFGRVMHVSIALGNAARAGAELGSMNGFTEHTREAWELRVVAAVREEISETMGVESEQVEVTVSTTTDACDLFEVTVDADYTFNTIVAWGGVPISTPLSKRVVMRQLR